MNASLGALLLVGAKFIAASIFLVLVYLVFFRERASFNHNRVFLLTIVGVSLLFTFTAIYTIPLPVQSPVQTVRTGSAVVQETASYPSGPMAMLNDPVIVDVQHATPYNSFSPTRVVALVYGFVVLVLFGVLSVQLLRIMKLKRRSKVVHYSGVDVYQSNEVRSGFSFYKFIFLSESLNDTKRAIILQHERWHIRHRHYIDMILIEFLCRLFWFNPVVWWIRKELRSVGEFQVDKSVLSEGQDIYTYQTMILEDVISMNPYLAHGFNQSFTKKRFIKMKTSMSVSNLALNRILLVVSFVLGFALFSFSFEAVRDDAFVDDADGLEMVQLIHGSISNIEAYLAAGKTDSASKAQLLRKIYVPSELAFNGIGFDQIPLSQSFLDIISPELLKTSLMELRNIRASLVPLRNANMPSDSLNMVALSGLMIVPLTQATIEYMMIKASESLMSGMMGMFQSMMGSEGESANQGSGRLGSIRLEPNSLGNLFGALSLGVNQEDAVLEAEAERKRQQDRDGDIWSKAYRVQPEQIVLSEQPYSHDPHMVSVDVNNRKKETYVTLAVPIGGDQWWIRFDKLIELVDIATKDRYLVRRIERDMPLNKTMIVSGHAHEMIEVTLVFPLLKSSVTTIDFVERTSHDADLMSNNSGNWVFRNVSLADYPARKVQPSVFQ